MKRRASKSRRTTSTRIGQRSGIDEEPCRIKRYRTLTTIATAIAIRRKPTGIKRRILLLAVICRPRPGAIAEPATDGERSDGWPGRKR
jgi:hypothetical protein